MNFGVGPNCCCLVPCDPIPRWVAQCTYADINPLAYCCADPVQLGNGRTTYVKFTLTTPAISGAVLPIPNSFGASTTVRPWLLKYESTEDLGSTRYRYVYRRVSEAPHEDGVEVEFRMVRKKDVTTKLIFAGEYFRISKDGATIFEGTLPTGQEDPLAGVPPPQILEWKVARADNSIPCPTAVTIQHDLYQRAWRADALPANFTINTAGATGQYGCCGADGGGGLDGDGGGGGGGGLGDPTPCEDAPLDCPAGWKKWRWDIVDGWVEIDGVCAINATPVPPSSPGSEQGEEVCTCCLAGPPPPPPGGPE